MSDYPVYTEERRRGLCGCSKHDTAEERQNYNFQIFFILLLTNLIISKSELWMILILYS